MDLNSYLKEIKKAPAVIYLVSGDEPVLFQDLRNQTQRIANLQRAELLNFDFAEDSAAKFMVALDNSSLFASHRYLYLENFFGSVNQQFSKKQLAFLKQRLRGALPEVTLIFVVDTDKIDRRLSLNKLLTTLARNVELAKLKPGEVTANLKSYFQTKFSTPVAPAVISEILARTNYDYTALRGELPKLDLFLNQRQTPPTIDEIKQLITPNVDHNVFHLIGDLSTRDFNQVMVQYQELLDYFGQPYSLNGALISNFQLLLQVKILQEAGYDRYQLAKKLTGIHPYRIKLAQQNGQQFSRAQLIQVNQLLLVMDQKIKTSTVNYDELFQELVLQLKGSFSKF